MRPKKHETTAEGDLFRARLDQIINMKHELVQLAGKIDWAWIDDEMALLYSDKGRPGIESRFAGREPAGGPRERCVADQGPGAGHRRHHGAVQNIAFPTDCACSKLRNGEEA